MQNICIFKYTSIKCIYVQIRELDRHTWVGRRHQGWPCRIPQESAAHANRQAMYFILAKLLFSLLAAGFTAHSTGEIAEWG